VCGILNEFFVNIGPKMASSIPNLDTENNNNTFELNCLGSYFSTSNVGRNKICNFVTI